MSIVRLHKTVGVKVGGTAGVAVVQVGGGAAVAVQSMTMTDTADASGTAQQCIELAEAGSDMVRITVNVPEAAAAVPEVKQRMVDGRRRGARDQTADARCRLSRAAHRRLSLQRPPAADEVSRLRARAG